jgi:hypothetical protein
VAEETEGQRMPVVESFRRELGLQFEPIIVEQVANWALIHIRARVGLSNRWR